MVHDDDVCSCARMGYVNAIQVRERMCDYIWKTFTNIIFSSMNCNYFSKSYFQQVAMPHPTAPLLFSAASRIAHSLLEMLTKPESAECLDVGTMMPSVICKHSNACRIFTQQLSRMKLKCFVIIIEILNKPLTRCLRRSLIPDIMQMLRATVVIFYAT